MENLRFPVFDGDPMPPKRLSMEEYFRFVDENRRVMFNREAYLYWKKEKTVRARFVLDPAAGGLPPAD